MSDELVKARYMGNPAEMWLDSGDPDDRGRHIELLPRHLYELPRSVVQDRDDFKIQEEDVADEPDEKAREAREKQASAEDAQPVSKAKERGTERATDRTPREEG